MHEVLLTVEWDTLAAQRRSSPSPKHGAAALAGSLIGRKYEKSPVPEAKKIRPVYRWPRADIQSWWQRQPNEKDKTLSTATTTTAMSTTELHDPPVPVRVKLAAAWTTFMFFYIYVDHLHLYKPGIIDDIRAGVVFDFDISQTFVVTSLMIVGIPALMILLSVALPARASRVLNLVVASLSIPIAVFNVVGESWVAFYGLGVLVEVIVLAYILRSAWTWPRTAS